MISIRTTSIPLLVAAWLIACGTDDLGSEGANAGAPSGNVLPEIGPAGTSSACVTEVASAELAPTNIVMIYDKSGSMGDTATGFDPKKRWEPVGSGLKQFFADPYSRTVRASLQFFPMNDDTVATTCAYPYAKPAVELTSASDTAFVTAIDRMTPSGGTPTLPALEGAIAYARGVAAARPLDRTIVVLVTDGEPGFWDPATSKYTPGCPNNDIAHVAATARGAKAGSPSVPTYVIGVGPELEALNAIAAAGGTSAAIMVDADEASATRTAIVDALDDIRRKESSCDFAIPPPPAGQRLDPLAVNVALQKTDGSEKVLEYSKECSSPEGWRYDDPTAPQRIVLCSSSCDQARRDDKLSIAFGCQTKLDVH